MMLRQVAAASVAAVSLAAALGACGGSEGPRSDGEGERSPPVGLGAEVGAPERRAATVALRGYLAARERHAWGLACSHLASGVATDLARMAAGSWRIEGSGCAAGLEAISGRMPGSGRGGDGEAPEVDWVRVKGDRGFVRYRVDGVPYGITIAVEDGGFRIVNLAGLPLRGASLRRAQ